MKKYLLFISLFLICSIQLFSVENGRGVVRYKSSRAIAIDPPMKNNLVIYTLDSTMPVRLITGEIIPFYEVDFNWGMALNFQYEGSKMLSASIDRNGWLGTNYIVGAVDLVDTINQTCRVNGMLFKTTPSTYQFIRENLVSTSLKSNSDLITLEYIKDSLSEDNIATRIYVVHGGYQDFKRTGIIRRVTFDEFYLGDAIDTNFQEKFVLHYTTKIYNHNFQEVSKSEVIPGTLVDIYSFYDTAWTRNFVYELHIKDIPIEEELYITGKSLSANQNVFTTEIAELIVTPTTTFSNFHGVDIDVSKLFERDALNYTAHLSKKDNQFQINALKELPIIQTESTFESQVSIRDTVNERLYAFGYGNGMFQYLELNKYKTHLNGLLFDELDKKFVRFTTRKGSKSYNNWLMNNDVMAVEKSSSTENMFIGVVSGINATIILINDMRLHINSNTIFVKTDGTIGSISDVSTGKFIVVDVNVDKQLTAKTVYLFNQLEIVGRLNDRNQDQIFIGGIPLPSGEFTFYRGQGNQVTELEKILPNSLVKVVSLHGSTEAIAKFAGKTFPSNTATIARFVYVLHGPDPVSTNESVVTPKIFPNPSSTTVSITAPENIVSDVTISTMLGERVFSKSNVTGITQFSTSSLPIGQYIVQVRNNKGSSNQILQVIR